MQSYPTRVSVFVEFVRAAPPPSPDYPDRLFEWISYKYRSQHFDAICPVRPEALALAEKLRDRLWPSIPIVFLSTRNEYGPAFGAKAGNTGVVLDIGDEEAVRAAIQLLPETRHVALLSGAAPRDRLYQEQMIPLIHRNAPGVDVLQLLGLSLAETASRVAKLPEKTIIFVGNFEDDAAGRHVTLPELAAILADKANSPIFMGNTLAFGSGIVGGSMSSVGLAGEELGHLVARVLKGTPPGELPVVNAPHVRAVDWRQLKKWGIPESRLPPGTEVRFRKLTVWEAFRGPILAGTGALVLQALAIGFLLLERRRRSRSERAASASEALSRAILSSLSARIAILDQAGSIIRVSDNWFALEFEEVLFPRAPIGADYVQSWANWGGTAEFRAVVAAVTAVLEGRQKTRTVDYPIRVGDKDRWVEIRVERLGRPEGGAVVTHLDITQQKQSQLDRRRTLDELHHMNRVASVGQLAGSLAHELAQPLASILSNTQAATRFACRPDPDLAEIRQALTEIAEDDRRASSIIERLRTILRKQPLQVQDLDLNRIVDEVGRLIRNVLQVRRIRIRLNLAADGVIVRGDQVSLQQVVLNILNNGMDAVQDLPFEQRVLTVTTRSANGWGEILVDDDGHGIPEPIKGRLFDSFFTTKREGLGMGLSICRSIVETFGGRISAENRDEGGARFRISLPLSAKEVDRETRSAVAAGGL